MTYLELALEALMTSFYFHFNNWGLVILFLALFVRTLLLPIQLFNFKQQRILGKIQPEMTSLTEKYKDNPIKLIQQMNELKKQQGVKTGLTFLSSIVQIPLFMTIYSVFSNFQILMSGSFAWLITLGSPDPLFILPALVAVTAYAQQKLGSMGADNLNPKIATVMKLMPALSFIFMVAMPSGLVFYYAISGVIQLGGEWMIRKLS